MSVCIYFVSIQTDACAFLRSVKTDNEKDKAMFYTFETVRGKTVLTCSMDFISTIDSFILGAYRSKTVRWFFEKLSNSLNNGI